MISSLRGTVTHVDAEALLVEVGGVGLSVAVPPQVARAARDLREELRLDGVSHNDAVMFGPVVAQAVARLVDEVVPA